MGGLEKPILVFLIKIYERPGQKYKQYNRTIQSLDCLFPKAKWHNVIRSAHIKHGSRNQQTKGKATICLTISSTALLFL